MTITEAVEVLKKFKWREQDDWRVRVFSETDEPLCCYSDPDNPNDEGNYVGDRSIQLDPEDAIAIATYLELREAVNELRRYVIKRGNENRERERAHYGAEASWHSAKADTYQRIESKLDDILAQLGEEEK